MISWWYELKFYFQVCHWPFIAVYILISRTCMSSLNPILGGMLMILSEAMLIVPLEQFFNGVTRVEFLFLSYQMNMYLFPDLDNIENLPARSIYFFDLVLWVTAKTMWICLVDCYNFVDTMTFIVCCMCPSCVEMDSTKYILKYLTVRFFQVLKNPCSISTIKVYFVEIKHAA